jgi:pimeloyl-ACP methyl ester carboxylesterase
MCTEPAVRDEFMTLDGLRFHYRDWGDPSAPPVVLLHAYTSHARSWDTVARAMADRFRVLALDQRGHGESDWADDYHELRLVGDLGVFVDALGLETFHLAGFSIGGSHACSYALLYPDRVTRLVLFECFTRGDEQGNDPWIAAMRAHMDQVRSLPASPDEAVAAFRSLAPYAAEDELRRWILAGLKQSPDGRWAWRFDPAFLQPGPPGRLKPPESVLWGRFARLTVPALLMVGAESWMVEPTAQVAALNARAQVATVHAAGHWIPLDNPRGFLESVGGFLDGAL